MAYTPLTKGHTETEYLRVTHREIPATGRQILTYLAALARHVLTNGRPKSYLVIDYLAWHPQTGKIVLPGGLWDGEKPGDAEAAAFTQEDREVLRYAVYAWTHLPHDGHVGPWCIDTVAALEVLKGCGLGERALGYEETRINAGFTIPDWHYLMKACLEVLSLENSTTVPPPAAVGQPPPATQDPATAGASGAPPVGP